MWAARTPARKSPGTDEHSAGRIADQDLSLRYQPRRAPTLPDTCPRRSTASRRSDSVHRRPPGGIVAAVSCAGESSRSPRFLASPRPRITQPRSVRRQLERCVMPSCARRSGGCGNRTSPSTGPTSGITSTTKTVSGSPAARPAARSCVLCVCLLCGCQAGAMVMWTTAWLLPSGVTTR